MLEKSFHFFQKRYLLDAVGGGRRSLMYHNFPWNDKENFTVAV